MDSSETISETDFIRYKLKPLFKSSGPHTTFYWISRGWDNPEEKVSEEQKRRSPRCVEFWIERKYSEEEATEKVRELQSKYAKRGLEKNKDRMWVYNSYSVDVYEKKGISRDEAEQKILSRKLKDRIVQTNEFRLLNGWTEEQINELGKKKANKGAKNGMHGRTPSLSAGVAISGIYKDRYYFRSTFEFLFIKHLEDQGVSFTQCDIPLEKSEHSIDLKDGTYTPDLS